MIRDLRAEVKDDGRIRVQGKDLLLAGANGVGGNAGASVFAMLICEAAAPFTEHRTTATGVVLDQDGDFKIDDYLNPAPPVVCGPPCSDPECGRGLVRRRHSEA